MPAPQHPPKHSSPASVSPESIDDAARIVMIQPDVSFFRSLIGNLKEIIHPSPQGPLEITSKPAPVKELLGKDAFRSPAQAVSLGLHIAAVTILFAFGAKTVVESVAQRPDLHKLSMPLTAPPSKPILHSKRLGESGGGGGGGDRSPLPASPGALPKASDRQFTPPAAVLHNEKPLLAMEPTIVIPTDAALPKVDLSVYGDPYAKAGPPSNGPGSGSGIGSGKNGGIGPGSGPGVGPGGGGGFGGDAYRVGGGVTAPVPIFQMEPEYSEEARKAKHQGVVVLAIVVNTDGRTQDIRVVQSLGMGLDEKAKAAVMKWRFRPGTKDSKAVATIAQVQVSFRLL